MIGVFDSGVGGLSVLSQIRRGLPTADLLYFADQARAPYGVKTLSQVAEMSAEITDWLVERGATAIVIACNTASASALHLLRASHPEIAFIGMEPAVKPAATATKSGVIGVLATSATFQGELFAAVVERHAGSARVLAQACPSWVEVVESGRLDGPDVESAVRECLQPLLDQGADTLVLGCTHFSFLSPMIRLVAGPQVRIMDPAPAIARQVERVASGTDGQGDLVMATSGNPGRLERFAWEVAGIRTRRPVLAWRWNEI